jgi:hypothetical protein
MVSPFIHSIISDKKVKVKNKKRAAAIFHDYSAFVKNAAAVGLPDYVSGSGSLSIISAKPEALRWLAPQRGLIASDKR